MKGRGLTVKFILLCSAPLIFFGIFIYAGFRFTHHIYDDATRINLAGQLRFRSFEIAWLLNNLVEDTERTKPEKVNFYRAELESEIKTFEDIIKALREGSEAYSIRPLGYTEPLRRLEDLSAQWQRDLKPLILEILTFPPDYPEKKARKLLEPYNSRIQGFVYEIDEFVKLLELYYKKEIRDFDRLRILVLCLFAIGGVFAVLYLRRSILLPVWTLKKAIEEFRQGNLDHRVSFKGNDEISHLAEAFNEMADSIKALIMETKTQAGQVLGLFNASNSLRGIKRLEELYQAICENTLKILNIKFVWLGIKGDNLEVIPVAFSGEGEDYLKEIKVRWDDSPEGMGPTGMAIKTGRPQVRNNLEDPSFRAWRDKALKRGFISSLAVPLITPRREIMGALNLYSERPGYFTPERVHIV